ncbi:hypothetical protein FRB93_012970 [Tulasnella sp. JGI-2019a]|nr:hypothetical protein FRB93_012970 [Tulasnella sp. JGI-2019a]
MAPADAPLMRAAQRFLLSWVKVDANVGAGVRGGRGRGRGCSDGGRGQDTLEIDKSSFDEGKSRVGCGSVKAKVRSRHIVISPKEMRPTDSVYAVQVDRLWMSVLLAID